MKSIEKLGEEYEQVARILSLRIDERKEKLKSLDKYSDEAWNLKKEIDLLYSERLDVILTARHLKNYYKGEMKK